MAVSVFVAVVESASVGVEALELAEVVACREQMLGRSA